MYILIIISRLGEILALARGYVIKRSPCEFEAGYRTYLENPRWYVFNEVGLLIVIFQPLVLSHFHFSARRWFNLMVVRGWIMIFHPNKKKKVRVGIELSLVQYLQLRI